MMMEVMELELEDVTEAPTTDAELADGDGGGDSAAEKVAVKDEEDPGLAGGDVDSFSPPASDELDALLIDG
jgi:hypothetical protein